MKLVSVIIPYYKKKFFIKKTIISVLKQTYKKLEIIIIYDDPCLNELKFIQNLKKLDKRIKIFINKKNLGAGFSRNLGVSKSKGDYIAFIDADDFWLPSKILTQINFMEKNNINISHTSYNILKGNESIQKRIARNFFKINDLLTSCDIGLSTVVLKKKMFNKKCCFPNLKTKEDFVLWLKILKSGYKIYGIKKTLTNWNVANNSLSSVFFPKIIDGFNVYNKYMKFNYFISLYYLICLSSNYLIKKNK
tara:strand:- start:1547 stop:2293 length:747 start_codon:yes stop_codon:yes gene_type:complete